MPVGTQESYDQGGGPNGLGFRMPLSGESAPEASMLRTVTDAVGDLLHEWDVSLHGNQYGPDLDCSAASLGLARVRRDGDRYGSGSWFA